MAIGIRHAACVAALGLVTGAAGAVEFTMNPYVAAQYTHDSNVYRFSSQVAAVTGTTETADSNVRHLAGSDVGAIWQRQHLRLMGEVRRIDFKDFSHLDHDEYALGLAFDGAILSHTKLRLELRDERRMASFEDRRSRQLVIERDQAGRGEVLLALTPAWQLLTGVRGRNLRSPLPDAPALPEPAPGAPARVASPDFGVHEAAAQLGLRHGIENKEHPEEEAPLLIGALLEYSTVSFSGVSPQPPPPPGVTAESFDGYALLALGATAVYTVSGLSSLDARLGLTQYDPAKINAKSRPEATGEVGYKRKLSAVTELEGRVFRRIVPYVSTADATTDTGIGVGARWEPIRDLTVLGDYAYASSEFDGLSRVAAEDDGRSDQVQNATLSVAYPHMRTLFLRVFGTFTDRQSNRAYNEFTDITWGAELSYRWGGVGAAK